MTKISIIIPVYNAAGYIETCLKSICNQTFKDIEIICINDGSTDRSREAIEAFMQKDNRIRLINQDNQGPGSARRNGIATASGEFLQFCDSDDRFAPDMCETMLSAIENSEADLAVCEATVEDEGETVRDSGERLYYHLNYEGLQDITPDLVINTNVVLWNKIFRRSLIERHGVESPAIHEGEDEAFYMCYMSAASKALFIHKPLYYYLRRNNSITGMVKQFYSRYLEDGPMRIEFLYHFLKRNNLFEQRRELFFRYLSNLYTTSEAKTAPQDKNKLFAMFQETAKRLKLMEEAQGISRAPALFFNSLNNGCRWKADFYASQSRAKKFKFCKLTLGKMKIKGNRLVIYVLGLPLLRFKL